MRFVKLKSHQQHLLAVFCFLGLTYSYMYPVLDGSHIAKGEALHEPYWYSDTNNWRDIENEWTGWTNRNFGGMPVVHQYFSKGPNIFAYALFAVEKALSIEVALLLIGLLSCYLGLMSVGIRPLLSLFGALLYGAATPLILSIQAGQFASAGTIAIAPLVFAGISLIGQQRYIRGSVILLVGLGTLLATGDWWLFGPIALLSVLLAIGLYSKKENFIWKSVGVLLITVLLAVLPSTHSLWSTFEFQKESTSESAGASSKQLVQTRDTYGYTPSETITILFPGALGESSFNLIPPSSPLSQVLSAQQAIGDRTLVLPLYWGNKWQSQGPLYFGIVTVCLFLLAFLFHNDKRTKWLLGSLLALTWCLSWSTDNGVFEAIFGIWSPGENDYRPPENLSGIGLFFLLWLTGAFIQQKQHDFARYFRVVGIFTLLVVVIGILFSVTSGFEKDSFAEDRSPGSDFAFRFELSQAMDDGTADAFIDALHKSRRQLLTRDVLRGSIFMLLLSLASWLVMRNKVSIQYAAAFVGVLALIDVVSIGHRFLTTDDFEGLRTKIDREQISPSDEVIQRFRGPQDRMIDLTSPSFQSSSSNRLHPNIGGFHINKLRRYQDVIDQHLSREIQPILAGSTRVGVPVLNLLNTRLFKTGEGPTGYLHNATSMGFAWFAKDIVWASSDAEELELLGSLQGDKTTILHEEFRSYVEDSAFPPLLYGRVELLQYNPGLVKYETVSPKEHLMVCSEIWYKGDSHWKVTIDGEPTTHIRANYLLRAIRVPPGKHVIQFEYRPASLVIGTSISRWGSMLAGAILVGLIFFALWRRYEDRADTKPS